MNDTTNDGVSHIMTNMTSLPGLLLLLSFLSSSGMAARTSLRSVPPPNPRRTGYLSRSILCPLSSVLCHTVLLLCAALRCNALHTASGPPASRVPPAALLVLLYVTVLLVNQARQTPPYCE